MLTDPGAFQNHAEIGFFAYGLIKLYQFVIEFKNLCIPVQLNMSSFKWDMVAWYAPNSDCMRDQIVKVYFLGLREEQY